jgi:hypothetical protein
MKSEDVETEMVKTERPKRFLYNGRLHSFTPEQESAIQVEFGEGATKNALCLKYGVKWLTIAKVIQRDVERRLAIAPAPTPGETHRIIRAGVKIPRTSARSATGICAKLLYRVDPNSLNGYGFEGAYMRPGRTIDESALWPTKQYPKIPVLLEYAGRRTIRGNGRDADTR